ncbi:MAG: zf-HC2 domain-containing protein [Elusimicrobia bacterium]|nr:zf-HC2 domain-containing protein [Elusimicrobiota bacterium]
MSAHPDKDLLAAHADGAAPEADRAGLESHLGACDACRREVDGFKSVSKLVAGLPQAELPVGFMTRLERRRRAGSAPAAVPVWGIPPMRLAAFAATGILVGFIFFREVRYRLAPPRPTRSPSTRPGARWPPAAPGTGCARKNRRRRLRPAPPRAPEARPAPCWPPARRASRRTGPRSIHRSPPPTRSSTPSSKTRRSAWASRRSSRPPPPSLLLWTGSQTSPSPRTRPWRRCGA